MDKDECAMGYCNNGQKCINTVGSYVCFCSPGTTKVSEISHNGMNLLFYFLIIKYTHRISESKCSFLKKHKIIQF